MFKEFELGKVFVTQGIVALVDNGTVDNDFLLHLLARHENGDWGDVCAADKKVNDASTINGGRVLSSYVVDDGPPKFAIWIITEWDRSVTTILLPSEY